MHSFLRILVYEILRIPLSQCFAVVVVAAVDVSGASTLAGFAVAAELKFCFDLLIKFCAESLQLLTVTVMLTVDELQ